MLSQTKSNLLWDTVLPLPWFCHQCSTQYKMWPEEKAKPSISKFFPDSPMQIYWSNFKRQDKPDWASNTVNLSGEPILIWESGRHSCHFNIPEHSFDLKELFVVLWKERWKGIYHFGQNSAENIICNYCTYLKLCTLKVVTV